jgi:hypothetical protein
MSVNEPNRQPVCWLGDYHDPELGLLRTVMDPVMIGLFNLSNQPVNVSLEAEKLGVSDVWNFKERLTGETFSGKGKTVCFPELPPHAGRVWALQPADVT